MVQRCLCSTVGNLGRVQTKKVGGCPDFNILRFARVLVCAISLQSWRPATLHCCCGGLVRSISCGRRGSRPSMVEKEQKVLQRLYGRVRGLADRSEERVLSKHWHPIGSPVLECWSLGVLVCRNLRELLDSMRQINLQKLRKSVGRL